MAQTLKEFIAEEKKKIGRFEKFWIKGNKKDPKGFPMVMKDGNEGAWSEQYTAFDE